MRRIYFIALVALAAISSSCNNKRLSGELTGVRGKTFKSTVPYGMVYVPAGTFIMGQTDQDITFAQTAQNRQVTVQAFFMDATEISNAEYHQFVNWVRDSIAITDYLQDEQFYLQPKNQDASTSTPTKYINWKKVGNGSSIWGKKARLANANNLQPMYYQGEDQILGRNEIDVRLLKYNYAIMNFRDAANAKYNPAKKRSDFILRDTVAVYPDTLVWLEDFAYAQNEPLVQGYFSHPAFGNYPVVGLTWRQARAFTVWRTQLYEGYAQRRGMSTLSRLDYEFN
jgi:sulfatase modifying factor 1